MKVIFHEDFYHVYTQDPASMPGRMESVVGCIQNDVSFLTPQPATEADLAAVHSGLHIEAVRRIGLFDISALAAGAAVMAAQIGLFEPCFGLIRPPGHHASVGHSWGFFYFNNMAIAVMALKRAQKIKSAYVLDILEGGYNQMVLGEAVRAFITGLSSG